MAVTDTGAAGFKVDAERLFARKRMFAFAVPAAVIVYLIYVFFAFNIGGLIERARLDNAQILVADAYSHKTHVERDNRVGKITVAIEGENKGTYADDAWPAWVQREGESTVIHLEDGHVVRFDPDAVRYEIPGFGLLEVVQARSGITMNIDEDEVPDWINASSARVAVTTDAGRLTVTKTRASVFRYFFGWELFWFTLDSPFYGLTTGELVSLALSDQQVRPGESNLSAMASDFWNNPMWRHGDVAWAIFETVLMAFLGTMGAALISLPLAFFAAQNFAPSRALRFAIRRLSDLLRGIDGLIWTIILSRAFGPGPLTGSLAILLTDTGTFNKLFSEALENVDDRQIEGLRSTGANAIQRNRFGVIPQISPVIISQVLYYLESNTRSATIIGAIVGGGIGLLLTQAIQTQKDWEEVSYYIILTLIMVMAMDMLSGWLRAKLIGSQPRGSESG